MKLSSSAFEFADIFSFLVIMLVTEGGGTVATTGKVWKFTQVLSQSYKSYDFAVIFSYNFYFVRFFINIFFFFFSSNISYFPEFCAFSIVAAWVMGTFFLPPNGGSGLYNTTPNLVHSNPIFFECGFHELAVRAPPIENRCFLELRLWLTIKKKKSYFRIMPETRQHDSLTTANVVCRVKN